MFLWAFLDKTFGLGYATPSAKAWIHGGSPTKGFLSSIDVGPFQSAYHTMADVVALVVLAAAYAGHRWGLDASGPGCFSYSVTAG